MSHVHIVHTTEYRYVRPVSLTRHRLMIRPQDSHDLRLHEATLIVDPMPSSTRWAHDVFGNSICLLEWPDEVRTDTLRLVSALDLTHYPAGPGLPRSTLDPAAEIFPFSYAADEIPDIGRLTERQTADPERQVDAWTRHFVAGEGEVRTLAMLENMTHAIKADFVYSAREAEGTQLPAQTLELRSGTCRDFALLMMEAARSLGLAARFVTGYLYDSNANAMQGGGATHAWCSIYLPGAGWVEYDPTNGLVAGTNLIRVGVARSPQQALPIAGGFVGGKGDSLGLTVDVSVRATPDEVISQAA